MTLVIGNHQPAPVLDLEISSTELREITALISAQLRLEQELLHAQATVQELEHKLRRVSDELLPDALVNLNISEFKLADGSSVKVKQLLEAGITEQKAPEAFKWLRGHGFGDLIKHQLVVKFSRGEEEKLKKLKPELLKLGVDFNDKEQVHPQTLKAFCSEQMGNPETATGFPTELFGVMQFKRCSITPPKPSRATRSKKA